MCYNPILAFLGQLSLTTPIEAVNSSYAFFDLDCAAVVCSQSSASVLTAIANCTIEVRLKLTMVDFF